MSDIYVFSKDSLNSDWNTMGLVGALSPTEAIFKEVANGESVLSLRHPIDEYGKYIALQNGNILICPVPTRMVPEIMGKNETTTVWTYEVKDEHLMTSPKDQKTLYKKKTGNAKIRILSSGTKVTVTRKPEIYEGEETRWQVKCKYGTGWMDPDGLELVKETEDTFENICKNEMSLWQSVNQPFRIYEVKETLTDVEVNARHISYDLLYDISLAWSIILRSCQYTINSILEKRVGHISTYTSDDFTALTNLANKTSGFDYRGRNPISAFLDPEDGVCTVFKASLIRDGTYLYFLDDPGQNRGITIEYGKNMTGIDFSTSEDELVTVIVPVGENEDGTTLYLTDDILSPNNYIYSNNVNLYGHINVYVLKCENCKVGEEEDGAEVTKSVARARMRDQTQDLLDSGCDMPKVTLKVEFADIGESEEYAQFKGLESLYLYDYVTVKHPYLYTKRNDMDVIEPLNITVRVTEIEWDCITDRMKSIVVGNPRKNMANSSITTWQIPSGINGEKISAGTINSGALMDGAVTSAQISPNSIMTSHVTDNAITTAKIADGNVTTAKIADSNITTAKIADGNVTTAKIADGTVTSSKLDSNTVPQYVVDSAYNHLNGLSSAEKETDPLYTKVQEIAETTIPGVATTLSNGLMSASDKVKLDYVDYSEKDWQYIINTPTTLSGYGITNAYTKAETDDNIGENVDELQEIICDDIEDLPLAERAHSIGEYFIVKADGALYKATDNIAIGDVISEQTNCETVHICNELASLKSAIEALQNMVQSN